MKSTFLRIIYHSLLTTVRIWKKRREKEKEIWNETKFLINASLNAAIDTSSTLFTGHVIYRSRFILKKKKEKKWKDTETKRR